MRKQRWRLDYKSRVRPHENHQQKHDEHDYRRKRYDEIKVMVKLQSESQTTWKPPAENDYRRKHYDETKVMVKLQSESQTTWKTPAENNYRRKHYDEMMKKGWWLNYKARVRPHENNQQNMTTDVNTMMKQRWWLNYKARVQQQKNDEPDYRQKGQAKVSEKA